MKQNSICPVIQELERVYDGLCKVFKVKKNRPIITIQTKGRSSRTLGWHWTDKWKRGKKVISELNVCAEALNNNPIETLVHEMVHHHNSLDNILDCNSHQYHNKHFKSKAESYGLNVEKMGRYGWAHTSISESLEKILKTLKINKTVFKLYRKENLRTAKAVTKMIKYRCGCTTVRCATELNATCKNCNEVFTMRVK